MLWWLKSIESVLINQFMPPTSCLDFSFTGINFGDMLHHICDLAMMKTGVDQPKLVNAGAQIDYLTKCLKGFKSF